MNWLLERALLRSLDLDRPLGYNAGVIFARLTVLMLVHLVLAATTLITSLVWECLKS